MSPDRSITLHDASMGCHVRVAVHKVKVEADPAPRQSMVACRTGSIDTVARWTGTIHMEAWPR